MRRETNMDADKARYLLFEKTKPSACLCNPFHRYQINYLTIFPNCSFEIWKKS